MRLCQGIHVIFLPSHAATLGLWSLDDLRAAIEGEPRFGAITREHLAVELFEDSTITSVSDFLQQDAGQLAPFLRVCHDHCAELEGYGSSRV